MPLIRKFAVVPARVMPLEVYTPLRSVRDLFKFTVLRVLANVLPADSCSSLQSAPNVEYPVPVVVIVPVPAVTVIGVTDAGVLEEFV